LIDPRLKIAGHRLESFNSTSFAQENKNNFEEGFEHCQVAMEGKISSVLILKPVLNSKC